MPLSRSYGGGDFTEPRTCAAGVEAFFCFFCQFAFLRMPAFLPASQTPQGRVNFFISWLVLTTC
jgi:hypothetical protein